MNPENYFLKDGYKSREKPTVFNDNEEDALTYQIDVYKFAAEVASQRGLKSTLDIGCGFALKLVEYLLPITPDILGIDQHHAIDYCRSNHAAGTWIVDDLERPESIPHRRFDLIVSADVIEHLVDPDNLLDYIKACAHGDSMIVISTPERDLRRGKETMGPPNNGAHVREWNQRELASYLDDRGMDILDHKIVNLRAGMPTCQLVLCRAGQTTLPDLGDG